MITLTINGKRVEAEKGTTLLKICRRLSISIPTLCYHPDLTPAGTCRLCTVEVSENGKTQMVTACNYPARDGADVRTHSERVLRARRVLTELLLARHPQARVIQDLAREMGIKKSRYPTAETGNDCILCGLCVRTCQEIVGADAIGFSERGTRKRVGNASTIDVDTCLACGACEYVCPTGILKTEMDRIQRIKQTEAGPDRLCRYMRLGLVDYMICSNGFECWRCDVDQIMEDRFGMHPAFALKPGKKKRPFQINGFAFAPELSYTKRHVWARPMDRLVRLGLDALAAIFSLGADAINLPSVGARIEKDQILAKIVSAGKAIQIPSPLGGVVSAVNPDVEENPTLVWRDPYRRGWVVMIRPEDPKEVSGLRSGIRAREWFTREAAGLSGFLRGCTLDSGHDVVLESQQLRRTVQREWDRIEELLSITDAHRK